jgi:hypothetical protein
LTVTPDTLSRIQDIFSIYSNQEALEESAKIKFQIPGLKKYPNYPSSTDLISSYFFSKLDKFKTAFPIFDENSIMNIYNYERYSLDFVVEPVGLNITETSFDIRVRANKLGRAYAMVIEKAIDLGKPFGFQIMMGLDKSNQKRISSWVDLNSEYTVYYNPC